MEKNISVLMCVYNCEDYIEKSIKSIVNQTYKNFELIIINDGSTDSTVEKIKAFKDERIKIYDNDGNKGLPYSTRYKHQRPLKYRMSRLPVLTVEA